MFFSKKQMGVQCIALDVHNAIVLSIKISVGFTQKTLGNSLTYAKQKPMPKSS